jgi:hypothetical protein
MRLDQLRHAQRPRPLLRARQDDLHLGWRQERDLLSKQQGKQDASRGQDDMLRLRIEEAAQEEFFLIAPAAILAMIMAVAPLSFSREWELQLLAYIISMPTPQFSNLLCRQ